MENFSFPIFKTKDERISKKFRLEDPVERRKYFELKTGTEIEKLRDYLRENTFVAFLLGPKNSGKGTYTKLFIEAIGGERVAHISVGDIVRMVHEELGNPNKEKELAEFLKRRYRGFIPLEEVVSVIKKRNTETLLPTEIILTLVEREISRLGRKAIFIDGFPRDLDQVSYSLYFRSLIGYRDDPDLFVFIDVPEEVIEERMKFRVTCPYCQIPRNTKLFRTKDIGYDEDRKEFHLICDNPRCVGYGKARMISKEGDNLGIEAIRDRLEADRKVMELLLRLQGVPKIYLRNSVPVAMARDYIDDYEITPAYRYKRDSATGRIEVLEEPWTIKDDNGEISYSLLAPPVAVGLIKQMAQSLGL